MGTDRELDGHSLINATEENRKKYGHAAHKISGSNRGIKFFRALTAVNGDIDTITVHALERPKGVL